MSTQRTATECSTIVLAVFGLVAAACAETAASANVQHNWARYYGSVVLTLVNDSDLRACAVRIGPSSDPQWGDSWLDRGEVILPHQSRAFEIAGGPQWDVRVDACPSGVISTGRHMRMMQSTRLSIRTMQPIDSMPQAAPTKLAPAQ